MSQPSSTVIIPTRLDSRRFPQKALALIKGMPMVERVWRLAKASRASEVYIATPDQALADACAAFGAETILIKTHVATGSDCVMQALLETEKRPEIVLNMQGDAPLIPPSFVNELIDVLEADPTLQIATPMIRLEGDELSLFLESKRQGSSTGTTVTFTNDRKAMYFSKQVIPSSLHSNEAPTWLYRHIGLYGFRYAALKTFSALPVGMFEEKEKLEQLRALEHGIPIQMVEMKLAGRHLASVDRPEDIATVERIIENEGELL